LVASPAVTCFLVGGLMLELRPAPKPCRRGAREGAQAMRERCGGRKLGFLIFYRAGVVDVVDRESKV
jgi:hypothetical protein